MFNIYQKTLSRIINFEGIGLHSGKLSKVKVLPAEDNTGIVFKRVDLDYNNFFAEFSMSIIHPGLLVRRLLSRRKISQ